MSDGAALPWRDGRGLHHPRDEAEVVALVRYARARGLQVRVRGAQHSIPAAIHTDATVAPGAAAPPGLEVVLDRMAEVRHLDEARGLVTVGAGCRLGADPRDVTGVATDAASLGAWLAARGWALADLGGVSHQSIAGFLATGSSGGTLRHSVLDAVVGLRLVDGTGHVHVLSAESDPARFHAARTALGLLGIVTEVTLRVEPAYEIVGEERNWPRAAAPIDLFSDGPDGVAAALADNEYLRMLWWAQPDVDKLVVWRARRATPADTAPARPYVQLEPILGSTWLTVFLGGSVLRTVAWWRDRRILRPEGPGDTAVDRAVVKHVIPGLFGAFVPIDTAPRPFRADWRTGLPMDDQIDETLLRVEFTELFLPVAKAGEALRRIRDLIAREGMRVAGTFAIELYGARGTEAWLAPSHGGDQVRIDVFWTPRPGADPTVTFFPAYWALLRDLGARPHWGKYMPRDPAALRAAYPRFEDFLAVRAELDPDGTFLTRYWREHLGLQAPAPTPPRAWTPPPNAVGPARPAAPLGMPYRPERPAPGFRGAHTVTHAVRIDGAALAEAEDTPGLLARAHAALPGYLGEAWPSGPPDTAGATLDVTLLGTSLRLRALAVTPGRVVAALEASTLPIAARLLETIEAVRLPDGTDELRWTVTWDPHPGLGLPAALVRAVLARAVARALATLARPAPAPALEVAG